MRHQVQEQLEEAYAARGAAAKEQVSALQAELDRDKEQARVLQAERDKVQHDICIH